MGKDKKSSSAWNIQFDHYDPADEGRRESLLAIGNGSILSRAASLESRDDKIHYPGTYRVGCYNELTSRIEGQDVKNESVVNLPNWLPLSFRLEKGNWFSMDDVAILDYRQALNMQHGLLSRRIRFSDKQGKETLLQECRFISMDQPDLMVLSLELTPLNWSGALEICTGLDGRVNNSKVRRYKHFNGQHLDPLKTGTWSDEGIELLARTNQSNISIALAEHAQVFVDTQKISTKRLIKAERDYIFSTLSLSVEVGKKITVEKKVALVTSPDTPVDACAQKAREVLHHAPDFGTLLKAHERAWEQLWQRCHLDMDDKEQLRYFRLHIFHILQNFSPHTTKLDVGVPPSGWQGEEYHGQVFWDELFVFPFLTFHFPDSARALLYYRYNRLDAARQMAREHGYRGAMFPWRSASDGYDETPPFQFNPISGHWLQDYTYLQRHIGSIIAFNVWYYVQATDDSSFLNDVGAELFFEIARFWASMAKYNGSSGRYELHGVAGPDEYHTHNPDTQMPGLDNNTFTNLMAVWVLSQARVLLNKLSAQRQQELKEKLGLSAEELAQWETISRRMRIVFNDDGTLCQFEGFDKLKKFNLQAFRKQHGEQRLDWHLEKTGDAVAHYQIAKQADTPLLLYLFPPSELLALFQRLGYTMSEDLLEKTLWRHLEFTAHDSSLSRIVFAGALAHFDLTSSWSYFEQTQQTDMSPEDKGAAEGIHLGAMGGTLAVLQHHYLRLKVQSGALEANPNLPDKLAGLQYTLSFRGTKYVFGTKHKSLYKPEAT